MRIMVDEMSPFENNRLKSAKDTMPQKVHTFVS